MEIPETFKFVFGTVLITAIGTIFAITGNFVNIKDRFVKWTELRKKSLCNKLENQLLSIDEFCEYTSLKYEQGEPHIIG